MAAARDAKGRFVKAGTSMGGVEVEVGADTGPLERAVRGIDKAFGPLQNRLKAIGENMTKYVTLPLAALGTVSLLTAGRMDSLRRGLIAVTGSAEEADKQLVRLKEVAKLPGLGFEEAVQGSIRLQAVGYSAEEAERLLKGFGNALATIGGGRDELARINLALSQMASSPKVLQEEINQIREVLPQFTALMIDAFGTNRSEDIQKMGVSGREFVTRMLVELEKMPRATAGIANDLENLQDIGNEAFTAIGNAMIPVVTRLLDKVVPAIQKATAAFSSLDAETQETIVTVGAFTAALGPLAVALNLALTPLGKIITFLKTPAGAFTGFIAAAGGAAALLLEADKKSPGLAASMMDPTWASVRPQRSTGAGRPINRFTQGLFTERILNQFAPEHFLPGATVTAGGGVTEKVFEPIIKGAFNASAAVDKLRAKLAGVMDPGAAGAHLTERFGKLFGMGILNKRPTGDGTAVGLREREVMFRGEQVTASFNRGAKFSMNLVGMPTPEQVAALKAQIDAATPSITAAQVAAAEWGFAMRSAVTDATHMMVDGLAGAIGGAIAGFESLGSAVKRVMQNVVASITAAVAKALILKGLLTIFGVATGGVGGFVGGIIKDVAAGSGITQGFGGGSGLVAASAVSGSSAKVAGPPQVSVAMQSHLMGNGIVLQAVRQGLKEERRQGLAGAL